MGGATFRRFLDGGAEGFDGDAMPLAHFLQNYKSSAALAERSNVTLLHYTDMTRGLVGALETAATAFGKMKTKAERYAPSDGKGVMKSDSDFFHSGTSKKSESALSDDDLAAYHAMMDADLTGQQRKCLEFGTAGQA